MVEPKPVQPWPVWGRVLFFTLFGLFLLGALVEAIRGGSANWTSARVAVVVVAIPALALLLVTTVLRRRVGRSTSRLGPQLSTATEQVRAEQARALTERASGATDASLASAASALQEAHRQLSATDVEGALTTLDALRTTTTSWRSSPVADATAACLRSARRVRRTTAALDRQHR